MNHLNLHFCNHGAYTKKLLLKNSNQGDYNQGDQEIWGKKLSFKKNCHLGPEW